MELREAIDHYTEKIDCTEYGQKNRQLAEWLEELNRIKEVFGKTINIDLIDKNGRLIKNGDRVRLVLDSGEVREFDVVYKTVVRTVKSHPDFDDKYAKVAITGMTFCWNGYDLFPCIDENGTSDVSRMEVLNVDVY